MSNPRTDQDNLGTIVCKKGNRYMRSEWPYENVPKDAAIVLPLYLYVHGCTLLDTHSWIGRAHCAEWDSGLAGFIFATGDQVREWYGVKRITKQIRSKATALLRGEVQEYSRYLNGEEPYDG